MDFLDEVAGKQSVDIDNVVSSDIPSLLNPESAIRNQAASVSVMSDDPLGLYGQIMYEAEQGDVSSLGREREKIERGEDERDLNSLLSVLGSEDIPIDMKQRALEGMASHTRTDIRNRIAQKSLVQDSPDVVGETPVEMEEVRMGISHQLQEYLQFQEQKQTLLNQNVVLQDEVTAGKVAGFLAYLVPFATSANAAGLITEMREAVEGGDVSRAKGLFLPGSHTQALHEAVQSVPYGQRAEVMEQLIEVLSAGGGVFFGSENQFNQWMVAKQVFDEGGYTDTDKWIDNATAVLDTIFLGLPTIGRRIYFGAKYSAAVRNLERGLATKSNSIPSTPATIVGETNPDRAREMYALVVRSEGDDLSQALYGVTRDEAISQNTLPQPSTVDGVVPAKVVDIERKTRTIVPDEDVVRIYDRDGGIHYAQGEREAASANVINRFYNGTGMHLIDNMTQTGVLEGSTVRNLSGVFGTQEGGFLKASEALDQAEFAFREYGVGRNDIQLLQRINGEYVPVKLEDVADITGDFVVKVETQHRINIHDVENPELFDTKKNFFARIPHSFSGMFGPTQGSLQRWLVDPSSTLRKELSSGAIVGFDRAVAIEKAMLQLFDDFGGTFKRLDKTYQGMVKDYIVEANFRGLELSDAELVARGFNQEAITAVKKWRHAWDTHFWLENSDLVRTLNAQGFRLFENENARFFAKPVGKNYSVSRAYDPVTDSVIHLSRQDLDALYELNGSLASLKRPVDIDGDMVDHMVVTNSARDFLRTLTERDQVLNYRPGYYQRQYTAPKFIEEDVYDAAGNLSHRRVVGYADNVKDAQRFLQRKATEKGVSVEQFGRVRDDARSLRSEGVDIDWDLNSAGGRIAQRHRGKLLEAADGPVDVSGAQYIMDPAESAIRAAKSISTRVALRDFLESSKVRAMEQYGKFFPKDQYQRPIWTTADKLSPDTTATSKELADARTTVEYINYIESGYQNSIDTVYKVTMNLMADLLGKVTRTGEKAVRSAGELQPAATAKQAVFFKYLALNPARQLIVQTNQIPRLVALNPGYFGGGEYFTDMIQIANFKAMESVLGRKEAFRQLPKEYHALLQEVEDSGILASVDRSNLARGPLTDLAESSNVGVRAVGKALAVPRKVGYDFAEQTNLLSHYMVARDMYKKRGMDINDPAVRAEYHAYARNLAWDMNMGGDFPYNQNWTSFVLQFAQVPHKAILTYTSRKIPWQDKLRLAAADTLMFGVPGSVIISRQFGDFFLPEDKEWRDIVTRGAQAYTYNKVLSWIAGEQKDYDWSSLNPYGLDGWAGMITAALTGGIFDVINEAPSSNVLWKEGNDLREAIMAAGRYLKGHVNPDDLHTPEEIGDVLDLIGRSVSGGWSNYQKGKLYYETGKLLDKQGRPLRENYDLMDRVLTTLGFPSAEVATYYAANKAVREGSKAHRDEVEKYYRSIQRYVLRKEQIDSTNPDYQIKVLGIANRVYHDDPVAMGLINSWVARDASDNNASLMRSALEYANIPDVGTTEKELKEWAYHRGEDGRRVMEIWGDMRKDVEEFRMDEDSN